MLIADELSKVKKHTTYIGSFLGWFKCFGGFISFIDSGLNVILITRRRHFDC